MVQAKNLLEIAELKTLNLVAGENGLNRRIRWTLICQNLDIKKWVQGSELLFLTGVGMEITDKALSQFVYQCYICNISSIIILPNPDYIAVIPQSMKDACDRFDIPLFSMPWDVPMVQTTKIISDYLYRHSEKEGTGLGKERFKRLIAHADSVLTIDGFLTQINLPRFQSLIFFVVELEASSDCSGHVLDFVTENYLGTGLFVKKGNFLYILAGFTKQPSWKNARSILRYLHIKAPHIQVTAVGCSEQLTGTEHVQMALAHAKTALWSTKIKKKRFISYPEAGIVKLFAQTNRTLLEQFSEEILAPLLQYDHVHSTLLIPTLTCFLEMNGNYKRASKLLYIHRNTLAYRIEKIEEVLNCSLKNPAHQFELTAALMAKTYCQYVTI